MIKSPAPSSRTPEGAEPPPANDGTNQPSQVSGKVTSDARQTREVVGVFRSTQNFSDAVDELQSSGVDRARLSILAEGPDVGVELRARGFYRVQDLLDAPDLPRSALIEPESARTARGALVSGLLYVGAGIGTGAAVASGAAALAPALVAIAGGGAIGASVGGFLANRLGRQRAHDVESYLTHGGLVLWVRVVTPQDEERVAETLKRHGGEEVHAHGVSDPSRAS